MNNSRTVITMIFLCSIMAIITLFMGASLHDDGLLNKAEVFALPVCFIAAATLSALVELFSGRCS